MPLSQLTTTSTSATGTATTTPAAATTTSASSGSGGSSNAVAIGAGVGVPLGLLALGGIGYLLWRRRKTHKKAQAYELQNGQEGQYSGGYGAVGAGGDLQQNAYHDNMSPPPISEADSGFPHASVKNGDLRGQQYAAAPTQEVPPSELPNTQAHVVHEMDT